MADRPSPLELLAAVFGEEPPPGDPLPDPVAREIGSAVLRGRVSVVGTVASVEPTVRPIRYVDVVLGDGTGWLRCRFFGRAAIRGLETGCRLRVNGRLALHLGQACVCNPDYELCDAASPDGVASS